MRRILAHSALLAAAFAAPATLPAQQVVRPTLDVTLGPSDAAGGVFIGRTGVAFDLLAALRVGAGARSRLIAGATLVREGPMAYDTSCYSAPGGGCIPVVEFTSASGLAGWELGTVRHGAIRMLGTTGYYWSRDAGALGVGARIDAATPVLARLALIAVARGAVLPNYRRDAVRLWSAGVGLRLQ